MDPLSSQFQPSDMFRYAVVPPLNLSGLTVSELIACAEQNGAPDIQFVLLLAESSPNTAASPRLQIAAPSQAEGAPLCSTALLSSLELNCDGIPLFLGYWQSRLCFAVVSSSTVLPPGYESVGLRDLLLRENKDVFYLLSTALQLYHWSVNHRFCGRCGSVTSELKDSTDRVLVCEQCDSHYYPRIAPCMMALVTRGPEILLARAHHFPPGRFSVLAGFAEAGETIERTVHREVKEETGLKVKNLRYFSSQSWPFPHQLMLGFFCEYDSGQLILDENELAEAEWFHYSELPQVSSTSTLSGQLIEAAVAELRLRFP
ncbi:MAG: NAD(+) diphosphatase [Pseudomonadales bacterium]|nr:NAD(+) diphosphatase [Pseudomonadales bacterium]